MKILILNGQYAPGYKGGGPIQSCIHMVENLGDQFEFLVLCADRDYKEERPYENIKVNEWVPVGKAMVYYADESMQSVSGLTKILNETEYDVLYLNGFFSPIFTIRPLVARFLKKLKRRPIILTPRGDFTGGCENKKLKKYTYIYLVRMLGLYGNLLWHATSEIEEADIKKKFPRAKTFMVPNLPAKFEPKEPMTAKQSGKLRLVFVSRIFPKKNIKFALEVLKEVTEGEVLFDIYGPMEDASYWAECESIIKTLPANVTVNYCGELSHDVVPETFAKYHAFFFPTLGENYGHVIVEAMMNNCLALLSKGVTPWDAYIEGIGLGAPLTDKAAFEESVKKLIACDEEEFAQLLSFNNEYIAAVINPEKDMEKYAAMFRQVVQ